MSNKGGERSSNDRHRTRGALKLRAKLVLGFGLLSIAVLILLQLAHQYGIPFTRFEGEYQQHHRLALQHMNFVADVKKEQLERWLTRRREDVMAVAESGFVKAAVAELTAALAAMEGQAPELVSVRNELTKRATHRRLLDQLRLAKERHEPYESIVVADASSGLILASTWRDDTCKVIPLPSSHGTGGFYAMHALTATEENDVKGRPLLQLSRYICEDETPLGVVIFTIDPDKAIFPMLKTGPELGKTGEAVLIGPDGRVATPLKFASGSASPGKLFGTEDLKRLEERPRGNNGRLITEKDYRGAPALAVFRSLRVTPDSDWRLVVKQDASEALALLKESERSTLFLGLIGLGLAVGVSCFAADRLARPLRNLCRTTEQVRAGDLSARAEVPPGDDEVGILASTFNAMVDHIQRAHLQLENDVRTRTAELERANESLKAEVLTRRQAEGSLRRERDNFLRLLGSMKDGVYVVNQKHDVEYVNPTIEREFGPVNGRKCFEYLHGRIEACPWCKNAEVWEGKSVHWEWHSDRTAKTYDLLDTPLTNEDGSLSKVEIFRDITERKQAQEELRRAKDELEVKVQERTAELVRVNQALKTISAGNEILVRAATEEELLKRIVESIVEGGGYCCAWVGLLQHDQKKSVNVAAHAGLEEGFFSPVELTWSNTPAGQTATGKAIRTARPVVTRLEQVPTQEGCSRSDSSEVTRVSSLALPLLTSGQSLGVLTVYSAAAKAFQGDEICLLSELADDLAYGMHALRTRVEYQRATAELQKWVQVFRRAGWGVAVGSPDGTTLEMINPAYARMHGYTVEEMIGRPIADVYAPESRDELRKRIRLAHQRGRTMFESRHLRKDGSAFPALVDISTVRDESGQVMHRVVYTEDITELKSLEARIVEISEREQQRIGRDLHDGLCQQLTGISYLCNITREEIAQALPGQAAALDRIGQLLHDALNQAHGLAHGLHPVGREPEALMCALQQLASYFQQVYKVSCIFQCPAPVFVVNNTAAMHLYRIAQEAMNNAVKHGRASCIQVRLLKTGHAIALSISDNGSGFEKSAAGQGNNGPGLGLETMRFRARSVGGTLEVQEAGHGGVLVTCTLPAESALQPTDKSNGH